MDSTKWLIRESHRMTEQNKEWQEERQSITSHWWLTFYISVTFGDLLATYCIQKKEVYMQRELFLGRKAATGQFQWSELKPPLNHAYIIVKRLPFQTMKHHERRQKGWKSTGRIQAHSVDRFQTMAENAFSKDWSRNELNKGRKFSQTHNRI
jgi:hypothetical protein